ncbi:hypothetical protein [Winogradskyella sp.]|uniref:hypothetical protein n=1 Tax=Winogradskyella sp. TaxID=1883156 RepID=UPI0025EFA05C|nr:hypothetical protein [Winogradskyella sp.]
MYYRNKNRSNKTKLNSLAESRRRKNQKRKSKTYKNYKYEKYVKHIISVEKRLLKKKKSPAYLFLEKSGAFEGVNVEKTIVFPKEFSITENFEESIFKIYTAIYTYDALHNETVKLSFKKCKKIQIISLFLLESLLQEVFKYKQKLQPKLKIRITNQIEVLKSEINEVNKRLCILDNKLLFDLELEDNELIPVLQRRYSGQKNSKSYVESRKKITTKRIVSFFNDQLRKCSLYELTEIGVNNLEGIISETIDNSEQHSFFMGEWFVCAYFFEDKNVDIGDKVIEAQLHFMNLGSTIYKSFEKRREQNKSMSEFLDETSMKILAKTKHFEKENLITLLSLNEGVSSLRYEDEGRGTGTIKLLRAFFDIGDHEDKKRGLYPKMAILSGKTLINIDNKYKYTKSKTGKVVIPLNDEKDAYSPPNPSHLKNLKKKFPGTVISLRVYLNENNLKEKYS